MHVYDGARAYVTERMCIELFEVTIKLMTVKMMQRWLLSETSYDESDSG